MLCRHVQALNQMTGVLGNLHMTVTLFIKLHFYQICPNFTNIL